MKKNQKTKIFFCLIALALFGFLFNKANASSAGLSVDTSLVMLRMEPGKETQFSFTLRNQTDQAQVVHLETKDIDVGDENKLIFLDIPDGPSKLVVFDQNDFTLSPGQSHRVDAKIIVPTKQETRIQMMTMVSFSPEEESGLSEGPRITGEIGVYTILTGSEAQNATGKIEKMEYPKMVEKEAEFSTLYVNKGDLQFVPQGKISVLNVLSENLQEFPFEEHYVFPQRKFTFKKDLDIFSPFGFYKIKVSFRDGNKQLLEETRYIFGKFFPIEVVAVILLFWLFLKILKKVRLKSRKEIRPYELFFKRKK
jgi:hypothetical protein